MHKKTFNWPYISLFYDQKNTYEPTESINLDITEQAKYGRNILKNGLRTAIKKWLQFLGAFFF